MYRCNLFILTTIFSLCIVNRLGVPLREGSLVGYECSTLDQKLLIITTLLGGGGTCSFTTSINQLLLFINSAACSSGSAAYSKVRKEAKEKT